MRKFLMLGFLSLSLFAFAACKGGGTGDEGGGNMAPAASMEASPAAEGGGGEMASPAAEASPAM